ncbi:MAG: hypothetical protein K6G51_00255 [Sphaerochaetaceae bacterium]|nr:hypothetical protein [Sphaerochaetaceae bacterium]
MLATFLAVSCDSSSEEEFDPYTTPLTIELKNAGTIHFEQLPSESLYYSTDDGTTKTAVTGNLENLTAGTKVCLYSDRTENDNFLNITCDAEHYVYGNIMSTIDSTNFATKTDLTFDNAFNYLFCGDTMLINHDSKDLVLPATTLTSYCYEAMFAYCTSLTKAPELPATELTAYCYESMFSGCTSLTKSPVLPAEVLVESCYSSMFLGCTSLAEITCLATNISASNSTSYWISEVAASGYFYKSSAMEGWAVQSDYSGVPENWEIQNYSE